MVRDKDGYFFDNHWGISGMSRFDHRSFGGNANLFMVLMVLEIMEVRLLTIHKFIKHFHKYLPIN